MNATSDTDEQEFIYSVPQLTYRQTCPICEGPLYRVRRRAIDKFISLFYEVRRYRCLSPVCVWEGNLRRTTQLFPD